MSRIARVRLESIFNRATSGIFLLDARRRVVYFNRACEELSGYRFDELIGVACRYGGPAGAGDAADLAASLGPPPEVFQGKPVATPTLILSRDGQRFWRTIHFFPCHNDAGKLLCVLGILCDESGTGSPASTPDLHTRLLRLRDRLYRRYGFDKIVAVAHTTRRLLDQMRLAAHTGVNVWITAEPGTEDELVARTIHYESRRRAAPFIPLDCGLLPAEMLQRDLFGSEPDYGGDPPGHRPGLIRTAQGGTLLLRNLTRLPRDYQSQLVSIIASVRENPEQGTGELKPRLIATDQLDPAAALRDGQLRSDLYFALSTLSIHLPPLRERKEDLPLLAQMIVESVNATGTKQVAGLSPEAIEQLSAYDWPGNTHELHEVIAQAHGRATSRLIEPDDLTPRIGPEWARPPSTAANHKIDLDQVLLGAERKLIELALRKVRGNKSQAAELLSISRPRLYRRMAMLGIEQNGLAQKRSVESLDSAQ